MKRASRPAFRFTTALHAAGAPLAERPLYILTAYTEHVPETLPSGVPGFTAANTLIGSLARACWDALAK